MNYHRLWVSYMMLAMILMMTPQSYRVSHRGGASGILPLQRKSSPPPQIISSMKPKIYILLLWKDKHILHVHVQNSTLHDYTCIYLHCTCTTCTLYTYTCIYMCIITILLANLSWKDDGRLMWYFIISLFMHFVSDTCIIMYAFPSKCDHLCVTISEIDWYINLYVHVCMDRDEGLNKWTNGWINGWTDDQWMNE